MGEVESVIRSIDFVEDVTVQTMDNDGNNELVAYVVLSGDVFDGNLREFVCDYVANRKPNYMVPSYVIELDEVPLTVTGKVDKKSLPEVDFDSLFVGYVAPRSETEEAIVDAFVKVFGRENIGVYDDFVRLGGDSLSAIKLLSYLDGFNISAGDVLSLRTPSAIADNVSNVSFDLDLFSLDSGCPLSEPQLNVYLDIKANDKSDAYLIPLLMNIPDEFGVDDIRSALSVMFDVHPVLGMCVSDDFDVPYLVKGSKPSIIVESGVRDDDFITEFLTKPFDLYDCLSRFLIAESDNGFVLYAVFHHIIFDAISEDVFKCDLLSILEGNVVGLDDSFLKVSAFNRQISKSNDYLKAEKFYESMLADVDDASELLDSVLADGPGSALIDLNVDNDLLDSFLEKYNISANVFFCGVFAYTLSRFVGSEKVLFNIVENGRDRFGSYDSIGMFVNTLPLLIDSKNQDIRSFVEYVSDVVYSVNRYNYYPYRLLANKYNINPNILFQFLPDWIMDNNKSDDNLNVFDDGALLDNMGHLISDLSVEIIERSNDYLLNIVYCDKYSGAFIDRFVQSYKFILNDMLNVKALSDISYVSSDDLILLDEFNDTGYDLLYDDVLDAFNANLINRPDNNLVSYNGRSYSYAEGAFIADKIAKSLNDFGVETGDCVGFLVPRSELYMFSVLGILSCGGVYVPLDDKLPDNRIKFILEDTGSRVVIVSDDTYARAVDLIDDDNVVLLNISDIVKGRIGYLSNLSVSYGDLACILYTSGTTGIPKGVKITRKSIINVCEFYIEKYSLDSNDVYGLFSAIGFDMAIIVINLVITAGACMEVIPDDIKLDMFKLNDYFADYNVSQVAMPTQVAKLFMESVDETSLELLHIAGENLGDINCPESYRVVDAYGPTESFAFVCSIDCVEKLDSSSVGFVNFNVKLYVLDEELRQVPIGAVGEIYIAGYQLANGYLNRHEETNNAFINNPYGNEEYGVLYRTGDMGRFLPDCSIAMMGRRDGQVKIRGNRVELGEVEAVIREIDYVRDVTVQAVKCQNNYELVAYIVSDDFDGEFLSKSIPEYVGKYKPVYMVPSYVVLLDNIPLTVNGKVDKNALPDVDFASLVVEYVAPRSETEKLIVDAFENVFNLEHIGVYDDFIRLGGDSLSAIKLLTYLDSFNISVGDILSLRTPYSIANSVGNISFGLDLYSLDGGCPLNESQLNVYLDIKANDKMDAYLIPLFMKISGEYSVDDIRSALAVMVDVHPVLGMCVSDDFDIPYLIKGSRPSVIVEEGVSDEFITNFLTKPFDLYDSLSRFLIVEEERSFVLYAVFHHIIFDALSSDVFKQDLYSILGGGIVGVDDSFLRTSAFNQQISETSDYTKAAEFYESILADVDDAGELLDSVLADGPGSTLIDLNIDNNLLTSFLEKHNLSENVFFSGVFAYTLSRFVGSEKVLFNIVENGRDRFGNYDSIGMFVNTLPLLVDCKNQDIGSFMDYVSSMVYGVMRYNYYPFRLLANKYDIKSNILFQFLPDWVRDTNLSDDTIADIDDNFLLDNMSDLNTDLNVRIIIKGNGYLLSVLYSDKYSRNFIEHFVESYKLILNDILSVEYLSDISYISSNDLDLLDTYNDMEYDFDYDDVLDAFNDNLNKYEDHVLVGYDDKSFTFGESAFIANEIVGHLEDMGIARQDFVALFVERSEWFLLSCLGVLAMGGVYVPIDTDYPDERIVLMLKDIGSKVVLVSDETEERMREIIKGNGLDIDVLNVDGFEGDIGSLSHLDNVNVDVDDIACVLYTSGTTGVPKGVLVSRRAVNNFVLWYVDETNFTFDDVYGMHCSYVFDIHTAALYAPLVSGGSLYVVPEDIRLDIKALNEYFVEHGCTHTYITSQVGKLFAESGMDTTIRLLCFGGMKLGELNAPDSIGPFETYGPCENLAVSTSIFANERIDNSSIGHFISNVKGYVLDSERRRVPLGAVGELYLAGAQLTKGYLNRDVENSNVFFDNPFDDEVAYERIYKTGDLVRFLPDGSLGIVGRRDGQVKIRGNRVELGEVESVIRSIDFVEDVTVQTVDNDGNNELVAYVVLSSDVFDGNLREFVCDYVANRKPNYMVPSYVIELDEVPLTVTGKVDKKSLPEVDFDSLFVGYVAPRSETEEAIVDAFVKVFGRENIGVYDDFVRLGGDSLSAIKLLSYLDGFNISAGDVLSLRTPSAIADNVSNVSFDLDLFSLDSGCPLSEPQLNVYLDIKANDKSDAYLIPLLMNIPDEFGVDDIRSALSVMFDVHPVLGMCVSDDFDVPYLVKGSKPSIIVESGVRDDDFITEFLTKPFDLYDCLSRFLIVENDDGFILYAVFHHIIFDAISEDVFKRNLLSIIKGNIVNADDSFLKASAFTQQIAETNDYTEAEEFYDSMLVDVDDASELLDSVLADGPGSTLIDLDIDNDLIDSFLEEHNLSENVFFSGVFAYTLSRFVGSEKVLFNIVENGRDRFGSYDSIGMFVNTLPLLIDCKNQDIGSFMDYISDVVYDVMRYNYYPFRLLANKYDIKLDIIFQFVPEWVLDNYKFDEKIIAYKENDLLSNMSDLISDLSVEIIQNGNDYHLSVVYSGKYSSDFVDRFVQSYKFILNDMLHVKALSDISYVSSDDLILLDEFNDTAHDLLYDDVFDAFNENLGSCPDNSLVSFMDCSYSYGEGAFIADRLAKRLVDLGVKSQDRVAFLTEPCEYYMFCVLGVLSCGGVYVPLDDKLPDNRIIFILDDADCGVVIVSDETYNRAVDLLMMMLFF